MSSFSLRLADDDYEALQAMALLIGAPMAQLVRIAIRERLRRFAGASDQAALQQELTRRQTAAALLEARARTTENVV